MLRSGAICLSVLFLGGNASAEVKEDEVKSLPGYSGSLPSRHFSGLIPTGNLTGVPGHLHYYLIESENDPQNDPLVLWFNGGPGSSSLIGLLCENGQIQTNDNSLIEPVDGVPQVFYNDYGWTKIANMLYLESPKGVGFSYCDNAKTSEECVNTDQSTAIDAYEFLVNWFSLYPEYSQHKFYITGESYAGIYIPMLMQQIDLNPIALAPRINLIGAAIGNGCWGTTVGTCAHGAEQQQILAEFYYGHGMYSQPLHAEVEATCGDWSSLSEGCSAVLDKMYEQLGDFDVYNIYDECGSDNMRRRRLSNKAAGKPSDSTGSSLRELYRLMGASSVLVSTEESFQISPRAFASSSTEATTDYECGSHQGMNAWLAEPSVVSALHVTAGTVGMVYEKTAGDLLPLYSELINKYQMLIYSGDTDACIPYVGSEQWTRGLNYTLEEGWHQWFAKPHLQQAPHKAGYAVTYDKFQFITVAGAGHMVPEMQPGYAMEMFRKFLNNEKF